MAGQLTQDLDDVSNSPFQIGILQGVAEETDMNEVEQAMMFLSVWLRGIMDDEVHSGWLIRRKLLSRYVESDIIHTFLALPVLPPHHGANASTCANIGNKLHFVARYARVDQLSATQCTQKFMLHIQAAGLFRVPPGHGSFFFGRL